MSGSIDALQSSGASEKKGLSAKWKEKKEKLIVLLCFVLKACFPHGGGWGGVFACVQPH